MREIDQMYANALGLEELPREDFVLPVIAGRNVGMWLYRVHKDYPPHGLHPVQTGWVDTEKQGREKIAAYHERTRQFWLEKIAWRDAGDYADARLPQLTAEQEAAVYAGLGRPEMNSRPKKQVPNDQRNVLRQGHHHYTVRRFGIQKNHDGCGFGGATFRWRFFDDPEDKVYESNDVFSQGDIPEEFWVMLPDNVVWVDGQFARPTFMGG